jgi:hypothetical protein
VSPVRGSAIDIACGPDPTRAVELIVGLRVTGPDGGGLESVDLRYSFEGREYVLHIINGMLICGTAVPEHCEEPMPSP